MVVEEEVVVRGGSSPGVKSLAEDAVLDAASESESEILLMKPKEEEDNDDRWVEVSIMSPPVGKPKPGACLASTT